MLKLRLQDFGHLMQRVDSLEKTLMLGGIGGRRRSHHLSPTLLGTQIYPPTLTHTPCLSGQVWGPREAGGHGRVLQPDRVASVNCCVWSPREAHSPGL